MIETLELRFQFLKGKQELFDLSEMLKNAPK